MNLGHTVILRVGLVCVFGLITPIATTTKADPPASSKDSLQVLCFSATGWYRHPEIPAVNGWLARTTADHGIEIDISETAGDIHRENLDRYDVVILNNANALDEVLNGEQREAVEAWFQDGGGIVALHATFVHQQDWPWFHELAGCDFNSDSAYLEARVTVDPDARDHPAVRGHGDEFFYSADWTNHTKSVTGLEGVQVLLRVDEDSYEPVREYFQERGGQPMGDDHPVAWTRQWQGGRLFYTELGHDVRSLDTWFGRQHIVEAIRWAAQDD